MKKFLTLLFCAVLISGTFAQDTDKKDKKEKTEKSEKKSKDSKSKDNEKGKKSDDAAVFAGEPEGDNYQLEDRREISKPEMPLYDVEQGFQKGKKKKKQQDAYSNKEYFYPAKPKNAWQIGLHGGIAALNGDINQNFFKGNKPFVPGYTFGASIKKPFSYMFSMRLKYSYLEFWNTNWEPSTLTNDQIRNAQATGSSWSYAAYQGSSEGYSNRQSYFQNSHTVGHDLTLDAIVSFGNMRFHKERTKFVFNVILTGGGMLYRTWHDALDANGDMYNYSEFISDPNYSNSSKKEVIKGLQELRDGVYETEAERPPGAESSKVLGYNLIPVFGAGFSFTFRVNRFMDIDLGARMMFSRDDLLDGHAWQETEGRNDVPVVFTDDQPASLDSRGLTREFDTYLTTDLGLVFKLVGKKKTEPLTLLNPMHYTYQKIAESDPEGAINELLKDDDEDGVPNRLDAEGDTPEGAPVNPKGVALDSDKDGIIDLNDEEPFSPPGVPVSDKGVAQVPPPACCAEMSNNNSSVNCDNISLPSIHFDKDKYSIKPEFYAHLHNVADKMVSCPDSKIMAVGLTDKDDNSKYNEQLSWNRVNAVVDYLNENYGIDRNRFIVDFKGESNANATTSGKQYQERKVTLEMAEPGATGSSNPPAPHPSIKAGSDN